MLADLDEERDSFDTFLVGKICGQALHRHLYNNRSIVWSPANFDSIAGHGFDLAYTVLTDLAENTQSLKIRSRLSCRPYFPASAI